MRIAAALAALFAVAGCSHFEHACPAGMLEMWRAELLFGRNVGGKPGVSDADWQAFAAAEITPRFPSGFSVVDAAGQWRGDDGSVVREASKVLVVLAPANGETRARLDAIARAYKARFHQEAVGVVLALSCASF
jgi:hypothetical protein